MHVNTSEKISSGLTRSNYEMSGHLGVVVTTSKVEDSGSTPSNKKSHAKPRYPSFSVIIYVGKVLLL
jgi:hypothetical protein